MFAPAIAAAIMSAVGTAATATTTAAMVAGLATTAASLAGSIISGVSQGRQASAQAKAQEQENTYNAQVQQRQQEIAKQNADTEAAATRRQGDYLAASQEAAAGGAGVTGRSFLDVAFDSMRNVELQAQDQQYQGSLQGYSSKLRQTQFQTNAQNYKAQSRYATRAAAMNASTKYAGSVLGDSSSVGNFGSALGTLYKKFTS